MSAASLKNRETYSKKNQNHTLLQRMKPYGLLYLMLLPGLALVIIFCYGPMYGLQIAFKDYNIGLGLSTLKCKRVLSAKHVVYDDPCIYNTCYRLR